MKDYICEMKDILSKKLYAAVTEGVEAIDTEEFAQIADIIKDLAEAHYYEKVTEAMENHKEGDKTVDSVMGSVREVWSYADPEAKKKIKNDLSTLINELH